MAESLRVELAAANIRVSTVYPGVTATNFRANSLGRGQGAFRRMSGVTPERVAQAILKTIRHERRDVFITLRDRLFITVNMLLPGLIDKFFSR